MENLQDLNKVRNILNAFEDYKTMVYEFLRGLLSTNIFEDHPVTLSIIELGILNTMNQGWSPRWPSNNSGTRNERLLLGSSWVRTFTLLFPSTSCGHVTVARLFSHIVVIIEWKHWRVGGCRWVARGGYIQCISFLALLDKHTTPSPSTQTPTAKMNYSLVFLLALAATLPSVMALPEPVPAPHPVANPVAATKAAAPNT